MNIEKLWNDWPDGGRFSGVFSVSDENGVIFEKCGGLRNRSESLPNNRETAFAIASGTKLFTALAVCKLIEAGKLSLDDKLWDVLPYDLGQIDKGVTLYHLLTHTSGIGDYIDEEAPNSSEQMDTLYSQYPIYLWERLDYYLQMIAPLLKKFEPGARVGYSNAGYVMLGLAVEAASGKPFQQCVTDEIIAPLGLKHTGFYHMNALPANSAFGYIEGEAGEWRSNIYNVPIVGGSDGGLFTCADDLNALWRAIFGGKILSGNMLESFLKPQAERGNGKSFGLGIYRLDRGDETAFYSLGGDYGVDFFTAYFPKYKITATALGNTELNAYPLLDRLFSEML